MHVRPSRSTLAFGSLAIVVASLTLTACGDPDLTSSAALTSDEKGSVELVTAGASAIREAASASAEQPTMQVQMSITIDGEVATSSTLRTAADGSVGWGTIQLPGMGDVPMLVSGGAFYYGYPHLPDGKVWVRIDFAELKAAAGVDPGAAAQQDPTQSFAMLEAVSDEVETIGEADVAGAPTTHYRFSVRIDDLLDAQIERGILTEEAASAISQFNEDAEFEVWIGADGLVRRMTYDLDLAAVPGSSSVSTVAYELEFSDYGQPVDVVAPAPETTLSLSDLMLQRD